MNERSSVSFFPKIPSSMDRAIGDEALVTKASAVGTTKRAAIPASKVSAIVKQEKDIMVNRFLYCDG